MLKVKQPGGNITVNVKFVPDGERNQKVTLYITDRGTSGGTAEVTNQTVTPNTKITEDKKSMPIQTDDDLGVHVVPTAYAMVTMVTGDTKVTKTTANPGDTIDDMFKALPGDAEVYVVFSDEPIDHLLTLNATGPASSGAADLTVQSTYVTTVNEIGRAHV